MTVKTDIRKFTRSLAVAVKGSTAKRRLNTVGKYIVKTIVARTRRGYGVRRTGGSKQRLEKLSRGYIEQRKANRRKLSRFTAPGKSNLTFSNQMLGSMQAKVSRGRLRIRPDGRRRGSRVSNQRVAEFVSKRRPFLDLSRTELEDLVGLYDDILTKSVRRQLSRL